MPQQTALTPVEQNLNDVWNEHLRAEFSSHSADETIVTMTANPLINQVPVMIGGEKSRPMRRWSLCPGQLAKAGWLMR